MAEARSSFDRSQLKANDNIHGRSPSVSYLGSLATRRNVSCSSGNDEPIHMLSSNLACHSAGLSVYDLFTGHRNWIHLQAIWPHRDMFACSGLSLRNVDFELLKFKHDQQKNHKNITPGAGEDTGHQARLLGRDFLLFCFYFPYQTAAECVLRLVHCECALRVGR